LGIMLYELVTGDVPFKADTPMAIVIKHLTAPMPLPRKVNPSIPREIEEIILKATAKRPDDRYQTAEEMVSAMEKALNRLTSPKERLAPKEKIKVEKPARKEKAKVERAGLRLKPLPLAAIAAVVILTVLAGVFVPRLIASPAPAPTSTATVTASATATIPSATKTPTPTPTTTPEPIAAFYDPILTYMAEKPPTFEDDFSTSKSEWGGTSEGLNINFSFWHREDGGYLEIHDSAVDVGEGMLPDHAVPGVTFPTNSLFNATNFALQYDFKHGAEGGLVGIRFRSNAAQTTYYEIRVFEEGSWFLIKNDGTDSTISNGTGSLRVTYNTLLLIVQNQSLAVYLNGKLLWAPDNIEFLGTSNRIMAKGTNNSTWRFDNVKFWNLVGVDF
ncbi:MAG: hypothetical protein KJ606_03190, partial [Chloroflexi bacterium]|nr:hypothetical protein [Chloroflexota bacterium]